MLLLSQLPCPVILLAEPARRSRPSGLSDSSSNHERWLSVRNACLAIALFVSPLLAEGQANVRVGGGPAMPIGDLSDGTKAAGPSFLAGVAIPVDLGYYLLIEGHHSRFGIEEEAFTDTYVETRHAADTRLTGGNAGLLIEGIADPVGFYGHGGVGWVRGTRGSGSTGKTGRSIENEGARSGKADHSFMFVLGLGINLSLNDNLG